MIVGTVYVVFTNLTKPPKEKITVCICAADNLFFWINTNPRRPVESQFSLCGDDHVALNRECFLDCSKVSTFLPNELSDAESRGLISNDLAIRIVEFLENSPPETLPTRHLSIAVANLKALYT